MRVGLVTIPDHIPPFDEQSEEDVSAVVPADLVKSIHALMLTRAQIAQVERIDALNKERALQVLRENLDELLRALRTRWQEI